MPSRSRAATYSRRRRRRLAAHEHDLTDAQWRALKEAWGGCAYCGASGVALQRDCLLPVSRGGRYTLANVAPACPSCNASKCNSEVTTWMRRKKLDERTFLARHVEILQTIAVTGPEQGFGPRTGVGSLAASVRVEEDDAGDSRPPETLLR